jgi:hypothetical protein
VTRPTDPKAGAAKGRGKRNWHACVRCLIARSWSSAISTVDGCESAGVAHQQLWHVEEASGPPV